jgi:hypothetical protein
VHVIQPILERLQRSQEVDESRLARLEWALIPVVDTHFLKATTLHKALARDPDFFVEILTLLYRPRGREDDDVSHADAIEIDEPTRRKAERAWRLLNDWRRVPGTMDDGKIDPQKLSSWVRSVRTKAAAVNRSDACDLTIGQILAYAPNESDGSWPCIPVREAIDSIESPEAERGFVLGVLNKRGGYSKALGEDGRQERELASRYETYAKACETRWPRTAAALRQVAASYREEARLADEEAER